MRCSDGFCGLARGPFVKLVDVGAVISRLRLPLRVHQLYWEAIDSWLEAAARSMGALPWNSSAVFTKCSLTMLRQDRLRRHRGRQNQQCQPGSDRTGTLSVARHVGDRSK